MTLASQLVVGNGEKKIRWDLLTYKTTPAGKNPWLNTQIGLLFNAGEPDERFELLGFGEDTAAAEKMVEKKLLGVEVVKT